MAEELAPSRIDAALMAALQALSDVQDDLEIYRDLWEQVERVKRELVQVLEASCSLQCRKHPLEILWGVRSMSPAGL